jgi:hypothetical protein
MENHLKSSLINVVLMTEHSKYGEECGVQNNLLVNLVRNQHQTMSMVPIFLTIATSWLVCDQYDLIVGINF